METGHLKRLGGRIRDTRMSKGVSLRDLAGNTGLTRSFLSQVERGKVSPSIASLEKISKALNMGLNHLFREEFPRKFCLIRRNRHKSFAFKTSKATCETPVSGVLDVAMVPIIFTLAEGGEFGPSHLIKYHRERFVMVQKGRIELRCYVQDKRSFVLEQGDCLYCKCDVPCRGMANIGTREAIVLWVLRAPVL